MNHVQQTLAMHEAQLQLYRVQGKRIPVFIKAHLHAAVYNLFRTRRAPYDNVLYEWFRDRVTDYLQKLHLDPHPKRRYQAAASQWATFQQYMDVYYVAFRAPGPLHAYRDVRGMAEKLFLQKMGWNDGSFTEAMHRRAAEHAALQQQLFHVVASTTNVPTDVWSHIASFLHPLYVEYDH